MAVYMEPPAASPPQPISASPSLRPCVIRVAQHMVVGGGGVAMYAGECTQVGVLRPSMPLCEGI